MKKLLSGFVVCLIACVFILSGCSSNLSMPNGVSLMKKHSDVVTYSDYVYFANSYVSHSTLVDGDNKEGSVNLQSLFRVKIDADGNIPKDDNGVNQNVEKVVSKMAGWENSLIYAEGDYIYFSSPNVHKTKTSTNVFNYSTYFKVKADGSELKELYTTSATVTSQTVIKIGDTSYILIYDGSSIVKITLSAKPSVITLAEDVTAVAFANSRKSAFEDYVYYTSARTGLGIDAGDTGNVLSKVNIVNGNKTIIRSQSAETITLSCVKDGYLYYIRENSGLKKYYANNFANSFEASEITLTATIVDDITAFTPLGLGATNQNLPVVYVYQSKLVSSNFNSIAQTEILSFAPTILFTDAEWVYYYNESKICRVSVLDKQEIVLCEKSDVKTTNISYDGTNMYFYALNEGNTTGNYYMFRLNINLAVQGVNDSLNLLGLIDEKDISADEE